ncbi:MAG: SPFH domain-containing protein, partial [Flavobacteriales bacterium]
ERFNNEIKNGAKLTVRESQMAVFVDQGQIADTFGPGMYDLSTENLPILSTLKGWKHGFESPFKSEIYFINTKNFTDRRWGTKSPIILNDDRFGMLELRAYGTYAIKVKDGGTFLKEIVGTDGSFTVEEVDEQLRSITVTRFTDALGESRIPVEGLAGNINEMSEYSHNQLQPDFEAYGLELTKFLIENVSMPEEIKKEIFELSRLDKIDLDKLAKMKAAKAMEKAAENEGGAAGAGMGIGMGFVMANQVGNAFQQNTQSVSSPSTGAAPPPLPSQAPIWVAIDGQQSGPYNLETLVSLKNQGKLTAKSLVWKEGMTNWQEASTMPDLNSLFGATPPPLPTA